MGDRWPKVGDLLIEEVNGQKHIGLIYNITSVDSVFVKWSGKKPLNYYEQHGYAATNIHNDWRRYSLARP